MSQGRRKANQLQSSGERERRFNAELAVCITALGKHDFHERLSKTIAELLRAGMRTVMHYSRIEAPRFLSTEGLDLPNLKRYEEGYYRFDPIYERCLEAPEAEIVPVKESIRRRSDRHSYLSFLKDSRISDELAVLLPLPGPRTTVLTFERSQGSFTRTERRKLESFMLVAAALHEAHIELILNSPMLETARSVFGDSWALMDERWNMVECGQGWPVDDAGLTQALAALRCIDSDAMSVEDGSTLYRRRLPAGHPVAGNGWLLSRESLSVAPQPLQFEQAVTAFLPTTLTQREREITTLALSGRDNNSIGELLGITPQAVRNRRNIIYEKLEISSERALFQAFLDHLMSAPARQPTDEQERF